MDSSSSSSSLSSSSAPLASVDTETLVSSIQAMRQTEQAYRPADYFHRFHQELLFSANNNNTTTSNDTPLYVDVECRSKMCDWCAQIIDHCQFSRETVSIAMNLLDRFLASTPTGTTILNDRGLYQLAAMTCLYTAIKIHEPLAISASSMANLSKGVYTQAQLEEMEQTLLSAVQWKVHPVTPLTYCQYMCELLHPNRGLLEQLSSIMDGGAKQRRRLDGVTRETLLELARMQTELAIKQYDLCLIEASTIAYAAIINAIHCMELPLDVQENVEYLLALALGIDGHSSHMQDVQIKLYQAITGEQACVATASAKAAAHVNHLKSELSCQDTMVVGSPRSVSATGSH